MIAWARAWRRPRRRAGWWFYGRPSRANHIAGSPKQCAGGLSDISRDGGLLSYGPDVADMFRRSASYVDRILRGAKAADLPVQLPVKFQMAVNVKTRFELSAMRPPILCISSCRTEAVGFHFPADCFLLTMARPRIEPSKWAEIYVARSDYSLQFRPPNIEDGAFDRTSE
jgi:hypothetical protein